MEELITKMHQIKQKIKKLKSEAEQIRVEILIELKAKDLNTYETDDLMLVLATSMRKSFDKDKAIEFIESKNGIVEDYYTESEFEILKIKEKGGN